MKMEEKLNYNSNGRYTANEAIDNFILKEKAKEYKHLYLKDNVCPYCSKKDKTIASPSFSNFINADADRLVRGKNEHEAGHARFTPSDKKPEWSNLKGNIMNILEDLRIERGVSSLSEAFAGDIYFLNEYLIKRINDKFVNGEMKHIGAKDEALTALHFEESGFNVGWKLTDKAREYYNLAEDEFRKWKNADYLSENGFYEIETITDNIIKIWGDNEKQEEENQQNNSNSSNNEKNEENGNEQNNSGDGNSSDNNGENGDNSNSSGDDGENGNSSDDGMNEENNKGNSSSNQQKSSGKDENNSKDGKNKEKSHGYTYSDENGNCDNEMAKDDGKSLMDEVLEESLKEMMDESKKEIGEYYALTENDEIIRATECEYEYTNSKKEIAGAISALTGYMEQSLKSLSKNKKVRNLDNGKFDVKSIPMLAKNLKKEVFYKEKTGISLDTTVTILLDESGSIGTVCYEFQKMAIAFSEVLDRLNMKFEILGHTTGYMYNRPANFESYDRFSPMRIYEHKNFNESYKKEKFRLGSISSYNCNIDGEALLYAFKRNKMQKSKRHIILVLSDGEPSGTRIKSVGRTHLRKMINFCRKNKTEVYGFGIGTNEPESFYGKENFVYIKNTKEINGTFFRTLSNILIKGSMIGK